MKMSNLRFDHIFQVDFLAQALLVFHGVVVGVLRPPLISSGFLGLRGFCWLRFACAAFQGSSFDTSVRALQVHLVQINGES